jgi:hypothetical protein
VRTPYVKHVFDEEVKGKLSNKKGWVTAGVEASIPWPVFDVCIAYSDHEYILLGTRRNGNLSPPCIAIECEYNAYDKAIEKIYRFTSVLSSQIQVTSAPGE